MNSTRSICAIPIVHLEQGRTQMGALSQIALTDDLTACGDGFNESTVKVRIGQSFYFVFRVDLERLLD